MLILVKGLVILLFFCHLIFFIYIFLYMYFFYYYYLLVRGGVSDFW